MSNAQQNSDLIASIVAAVRDSTIGTTDSRIPLLLIAVLILREVLVVYRKEAQDRRENSERIERYHSRSRTPRR